MKKLLERRNELVIRIRDLVQLPLTNADPRIGLGAACKELATELEDVERQILWASNMDRATALRIAEAAETKKVKGVNEKLMQTWIAQAFRELATKPRPSAPAVRSKTS